MSIGLFLWASIRETRANQLIIIFSIISMSFVRPHIATMMTMALVCYSFLPLRSCSPRKVALAIPALTIMISSLPFLTQYVNISNEASVDVLTQYVEQRQTYNLGGNSSIDISGLSLPLQLFTYLFRPMPGDLSSVLGIIVSLENFILLILFLILLKKIIKNKTTVIKNMYNSRIVLLLSYTLPTLILLAMITANMGIASRQKWMVFPAIICLLILLIQAPNQRNQIYKYTPRS